MTRPRRFHAIPRALVVPLQRARSALGQHVPVDGAVLCALGGGADSAVMLAVMTHLGQRGGFAVHAAHVNHGLGPAATRLEEAARAQADACGVPLVVKAVEVVRTGAGVEADARRARFLALRDMARTQGATRLVLGHTATDVAETFLQRVLEGAGRGQGVMRAAHGDILRPLVDLSRAAVRACAVSLQLPFADDPMNTDPAYLRVFIRGRVLPLLRDRLGDVELGLARAAAHAADDHDALEAWARTTWSPDGGAARDRMNALPAAVVLRALRQMVEHAAGAPVRTGGEACRKAAAAMADHVGGTRRFKAGPVWILVERQAVRVVRDSHEEP